MSSTQDYVALDWIKDEIASTLDLAQHALETVAQSPDDASAMRACLTHLHQVHGTLKMVQLAGASALAGEMEELAQALMSQEVPDISNAQEILMQAILQMPAYLDRIQREQRDVPEIVRPVINNLRIARGEAGLSGDDDSAEHDPLALFSTPPSAEVLSTFAETGGAATVRKIRQRYQQALLSLLKKETPRENLNTLGKVFLMLLRNCGESPMGNLAILGLAAVEGVSGAAIRLDSTLVNALRSIDSELKLLADRGDDGLAEPVSIELVAALLTVVDGATRETPRIALARAKFFTKAKVPVESGPAPSFGPDDETLAAVAGILIEELHGITDKLDLYVRSATRNIKELVGLLPQLEQIKGTMSVIGLDDHREAIDGQIAVIRSLQSATDLPGDDVLLDMAGAFLKIERALKSIVGISEDDATAFGDVGEAEATVIKETRNGLARCKDAVIEYVTSDFDTTKIGGLPQLLRELRGGMVIINQPRCADVLVACADYVDQKLLRQGVRPELNEMDDLADALTSIDYYLERFLENSRDPYLQMVGVAETAITKLGYVPGQVVAPTAAHDDDDEDEETEAAAAESAAAAEAAALSAEETTAVEDLLEPAPIVDETTDTMQPEEPAVDEEILEIFVEEAAEVLQTLKHCFPLWRQNQGDSEAMAEVRRAFHTLKGSGRMVGATVVGELAWSIENMLNRVLDQTIVAGDALFDVIAEAIERVPEGIEAFRTGDQHSFVADELAARADVIASGGTDDAEPHEALVEPLPSEPLADDTVLEEITLEEISLEPETEDAILSGTAFEDEPSEPVADDTDLEEITLEEISLEPETEAAILSEAAFEDEPSEPAADDIVLEEITLEDVSLEPAEDLPFDETLFADEGTVSEPGDEDEQAGVAIDLPEEEFSLEEIEELSETTHDSELDEIFLEEALDRMFVVRAYTESSSAVGPELIAAFHTLKGSAGMAEVASIARVAAPLETLANNIYNKGASASGFSGLVKQGAAIIDDVLANLTTYRAEHPQLEAFVSAASSMLESINSDEAARPLFDFENIRLLGTAERVLEAWDDSLVNELVQELHEAITQAEMSGHEYVGDLSRSLINVYSQLSSRPDPAIADCLGRAHEQLVHMLDQIAASQQVTSADDIIRELESIDFSTSPIAVVEEEIELELAQETEPPPVTSEASTDDLLLPEDDIDQDVLVLFLEEAEELVESIDQSILEWSANPDSTEHLNNLLRHLHTLKGGSRLAGLNSLGEFTHNFESLLIDLQQHPVELDDHFFGMLNEQQDEITRRVGIYTRLAAGTATEDEIASMRYAAAGGTTASVPAPEIPQPEAAEEPLVLPDTPATGTVARAETVSLPEDQIDDDILPVFLEEAEELVESIDQAILDWSQNPQTTSHLDNLLRHLHTLKGGARLAGLASLGEFTHNFETHLIGIQREPNAWTSGFFAGVHRTQDEINRRVGIYRKIAQGEATAVDIASMRTAAGMDAVVPTTTEPAPAVAPVVQVRQATEQKAPEAATTQGSGQALPQQEMVRVASDLLEELISLAGESSITRGRVEQQIADFGEALEEMEETINRIREQVRRLEIEAESRETVFRTRQRDEKDDSGFDDLEMDRYTMLQEISRALSETSSDMMDLKDTLVNKSRDAETLLHQQARIFSELQEGLTRTRMVPFSRLIPRLRRIVRQISNEVGKSVRFDAYNVEGELDRNVLERIVAPLEHMLRNAVDHGIESTEKRIAAGKPEQGRISLRLSREGGYVVLTVSDDGGGINIDVVRAKAIERGLITAETPVSDQEVRQFIMQAGFSTAQKLTQISGRGVGMDVVSSEIKQLGGTISIDSTFGVGTEFTIQLPFTVSINRALMVVVQDEIFAVPLNTIEGIVRVSPYELEAYYQPDAPMFEYAGQPYRLGYMGKMLEKAEGPNLEGQVAPLPVILARSGDNAVALQVDRVIGSREVVVKSLGPQFNEVIGLSGATVLGDGSVVIILDVMALVRSADLRDAEAAAPTDAVPENKVRTVMIVDDSVTVRKVTSRLMERQGWEVTTAKDGVDALNQLQDSYPDIMLLDIEMPRMDGFEVLRSVRRDPRLKDLPIVMITSRTGEKHKQQAFELGVNRYLGKPFQEVSLLETIKEVLTEVRGG